MEMQKEHLENLIQLARGITATGVRKLDFTAFDTRKIDEYAKEARENWGKTEAWKEFEERNRNRSQEDNQQTSIEFMNLFQEFGKLQEKEPADEVVQAQVKKLQDYITEHFYTCTKTILNGLGKMYCGGGRFTENIDKAGGKGTAMFVGEAIRIYCGR